VGLTSSASSVGVLFIREAGDQNAGDKATRRSALREIVLRDCVPAVRFDYEHRPSAGSSRLMRAHAPESVQVSCVGCISEAAGVTTWFPGDLRTVEGVLKDVQENRKVGSVCSGRRAGHPSLVHAFVVAAKRASLKDGYRYLFSVFRVPHLLDQPQERLWKRHRDGDILRYGRWSGRAGDN
jgi:hypothetical protein